MRTVGFHLMEMLKYLKCLTKDWAVHHYGSTEAVKQPVLKEIKRSTGKRGDQSQKIQDLVDQPSIRQT